MSEDRAVAVVVPTFNRAAVVDDAVRAALALPHVVEAIAVVDGSTDGTVEVLAAVGDPRLRVVVHDRNRGQAAARNTGWQEATAPWVLFLDDDDSVPPDFTTVLLDDAEALAADVIGAPWINAEGVDPHRVAEERRARPDAGSPTWRSHHTFFTDEPVETPYLPANALVRRDLRDVVRFQDRFAGNAYREETAFYVEAVLAGARVVLTPRTCSWRVATHAGGAHLESKIRYELDALRNTWIFLRRYETFLRDRGELTSARRALAGFAWDRARYHARGKRARWVRWWQVRWGRR